jgi:hypothetical protein
MKSAAVIVAILGVVLVLCCLLVLWILTAEVIAFEIGQDGSLSLQRLWLPLIKVTEVRLVLKLGCILRADGAKGKCVPYVIVYADRGFVPMPAEVYSQLSGNLGRVH